MDEATATDRLSLDVGALCRRCGYDLRGLSAGDACPECGEAIVASLRSDRLRDADPAWLRRIEIGASCVAGSVVGGLILHIPIVLSIVSSIGTWMATTADPRRPELHREVRWSIRVLLVVGAVLSVPLTLRDRWPLSVPTTPLTVAVGLTAACEFGLLIRYFGHLAARLPDAELAAQSRPLAWTVGGGMGAMALLGAFGNGSAISDDSSVWAVLAFSMVMVVGLLLIIAFVAGLNVAVRFGKQLRAEAKVARGLNAARAAADASR